MTWAIAVGRDPDEMAVAETKDNFGSFATKEEAAGYLILMANARIETLKKSRAGAMRIIRKAEKNA
jgi:hypothetical protein